jgi:hypothetical protein
MANYRNVNFYNGCCEEWTETNSIIMDGKKLNSTFYATFLQCCGSGRFLSGSGSDFSICPNPDPDPALYKH